MARAIHTHEGPMSQKNRKKTRVKNGGVSVTLPALNEEENIEKLSEEITHYFAHRHIPCEIIIVNDGSSDETGKVANVLASKHEHISVIHHPHNKGYGTSLKDGFHASKYEYLFFCDADRQFKINSFVSFLPYMKEGNADIVIGYRIARKDTFSRVFLSGCFNRLMRIIFSIDCKDIDCAFKLFKKEIFEKLAIESDDFLLNTEFLAKAQLKTLSIVQVGVEHHPRLQGNSTVSYKHIIATLKRLLPLYRKIREFKNQSSRKLWKSKNEPEQWQKTSFNPFLYSSSNIKNL